MADSGENNVVISSSFPARLTKWRVNEGQDVKERAVLALYEKLDHSEDQKGFHLQPKLKCTVNGRIKKLLVQEGDIVPPGKPVIQIEKSIACEHNTVMKDLCCDCGMDLRKLQADEDEPSSPTHATVSMIHNIPELKVSQDEAEAVGKKDEERLLHTRKLALVVDLDQTMLHTTNELVPNDMKDVYHFNLSGYPVWYHTKFRPFAHEFLEKMSKFYELHIFTMGSRLYAHTIARMLDPDEHLFGHRIRSRDDCFNAFSKSNDLRSLFPRGDSMVCIIDDRNDVWNNAPNLIKVKPYQFFKGVGDINAPLDKQHQTALSEQQTDEENENADKNSDEKQEEPTTGEQQTDQANDNMNERNADDEKQTNSENDDEMNVDEETSGEKNQSGNENKQDDTNKEEGKTSLIEEEKQVNKEKEVACQNNTGKCDDMEKSEINDINSGDQSVFSTNEVAGTKDNTDDAPMDTNCENVDYDKKCNTSEKQTGNDIEKENNDSLSDKKLNNGVTPDKTNEKSRNNKNTDNNKDTQNIEVCNNNNSAKDNRSGEVKQPVVETSKDQENGCQNKNTSIMTERKVQKPTTIVDTKYNHVDDDDYLLHVEEVLKQIHDRFYETVDKIKELKAKGIKGADSEIARYCGPGTLTPCTKQIIKELQSQVLKGANIVFTGVIPTNIPPEKSDIWQRSQRLGAKVSRNLVTPKEARDTSDVTTHVIAARLGTEKTYRAIKTPGIKIVKPDWLWCCEERWEWVDERLFAVEGVEKYKRDSRYQRTPQGTPQGWKKLARTEIDVKSSTVASEESAMNEDDTSRERTSSSSSADQLMATLHPLLSFSSTEMEAMDKEVEELMNSSADESDVIGSVSGSSSSSSRSSSSTSSNSSNSDDENDNTGDKVEKRRLSENESDDNLTKKRKKELSNSDEESDDDYTRRSSPSDDDNADDEDDMAAQLEAQLSHE